MTRTATLAVDVTDYEMIRATHAVLGLLSARWSVDVLYALAGGTRRYSALLYEVARSPRRRSRRRYGACRRRIVSRHVYAKVPARVEYSLTPLGWSLTGPLMSLYEWAAVELDDVLATAA